MYEKVQTTSEIRPASRSVRTGEGRIDAHTQQGVSQQGASVEKSEQVVHFCFGQV